MNKEEITKEDILNVTGSMFDTMLDYVDNSNKELENLQQQNKQLKDNWNNLKEWLYDIFEDNIDKIKKCEEIIIKMNNINKKDTHQYKIIDICRKENVLLNKVLNKMQELESSENDENLEDGDK